MGEHLLAGLEVRVVGLLDRAREVDPRHERRHAARPAPSGIVASASLKFTLDQATRTSTSPSPSSPAGSERSPRSTSPSRCSATNARTSSVRRHGLSRRRRTRTRGPSARRAARSPRAARPRGISSRPSARPRWSSSRSTTFTGSPSSAAIAASPAGLTPSPSPKSGRHSDRSTVCCWSEKLRTRLRSIGTSVVCVSSRRGERNSSCVWPAWMRSPSTSRRRPSTAQAVHERAVLREPVVDDGPLAGLALELGVQAGDLGVPAEAHVGLDPAPDHDVAGALTQLEEVLPPTGVPPYEERGAALLRLAALAELRLRLDLSSFDRVHRLAGPITLEVGLAARNRHCSSTAGSRPASSACPPGRCEDHAQT